MNKTKEQTFNLPVSTIEAYVEEYLNHVRPDNIPHGEFENPSPSATLMDKLKKLRTSVSIEDKILTFRYVESLLMDIRLKGFENYETEPSTIFYRIRLLSKRLNQEINEMKRKLKEKQKEPLKNVYVTLKQIIDSSLWECKLKDNGDVDIILPNIISNCQNKIKIEITNHLENIKQLEDSPFHVPNHDGSMKYLPDDFDELRIIEDIYLFIKSYLSYINYNNLFHSNHIEVPIPSINKLQENTRTFLQEMQEYLDNEIFRNFEKQRKVLKTRKVV